MHVVTRAPEAIRLPSGLDVLGIPAARDNLVWLVIDRDNGRAAAVDGPDALGVIEACARLGLLLTTVLTTHTHHDHVGLHRDLAARGRLPGIRVLGPRKAAAGVPGITEAVAGGESIDVLGRGGVVLDTEGHIDGHVSYVIDGALFCGDALFTGGCGRMFAGPPAVFHAGLERLRSLPAETLVFCGHEYTEDNLRFALTVEPANAALRERVARAHVVRAEGRTCVPSTIADERATNPFLRWDSAELLANLRLLAPGVALNSPVDVFAATRALKDSAAYKRD